MASTLRMPMTDPAIPCPAPILPDDFANCRIPGGVDLWTSYGFYSPGVCFVGYEAVCTLADGDGHESPTAPGETAVRCIPSGYNCNGEGEDTRFATTRFQGEVLSAPAFEIRWRSEDVDGGTRGIPVPGGPSRDEPDVSSTIDAPISTSEHSSAATTTTDISMTTSDGKASTTSTARQPATMTRTAGYGGAMPQLSSSSIAGIAVGGSIGVLVMVLLVGFVARRRRRKDHSHQTTSLRIPAGFWDHGTDTDRSSVYRRPGDAVELENRPMQPKELPANSKAGDGKWQGNSKDAVQVRDFATELDSQLPAVNSIPVELEATHVPDNGTRQMREPPRKS